MIQHPASPFLSLSTLRLAAVGLLIAAVALPGHAQYKVIGADGKVTYTDRLPATSQGKVTTISARGGVAASDAGLPLELRQALARYPVTLYVMAQGCEPCDVARQLLRQRGIPVTEKQVQTANDVDALERLTGGRDAPSLTIGSQTLRGLAPEVWNSYLDAAGYPRESRLPTSYEYPPALPIVERSDADAKLVLPRLGSTTESDATAGARSPARPARAATPPPTSPATSPAGGAADIRF